MSWSIVAVNVRLHKNDKKLSLSYSSYLIMLSTSYRIRRSDEYDTRGTMEGMKNLGIHT